MLWESQTREIYLDARKNEKIAQNPCITVPVTILVLLVLMYSKSEQTQISASKFLLPFEGKLFCENRWVMMADLIPWQEFEDEYASLFSEEMRAPAKSFPMALGALRIKDKLGISNRETVEQIKEKSSQQQGKPISSSIDKRVERYHHVGINK